MTSYRPITASFYIAVAPNAHYHETDLIPILSNLESIVQPFRTDPVDLDGFVSLKWRGEELLGLDYWRELNILTMFHSLLGGKQGKEHFNNGRHSLTLIPTTSDQVLYELEQTNGMILRRRLSLTLFLREWNLMLFRIDKVRIHLGNPPEHIHFYNWRESEVMTQKLIEIIGADRIEYTVHEDLATVLADPVPF